eukprot:9112316-Pyramimonas_sp.AAC.2
MNVNNMWGILKTVVDMCMKLGDGKYVLVKDPNKPLVRLYEVPMDAFEEDFAEEALPAVSVPDPLHSRVMRRSRSTYVTLKRRRGGPPGSKRPIP